MSKSARIKPLLYLIAIFLGLACWSFPIFDPDLGWQLLGGEYVASHREVPVHDFINSFNLLWHDYHWLGQLAFFAVYRLLDFAGLQLLLGLTMAMVCVAMLVTLYQCGRGRDRALLYLATLFLHFFILESVTSIRPQIFGILGIAVSQLLLLRRPSRFELPIHLLITVLLVNVHVYWIFIPFLWVCYRAIPRLYRKRSCGALYAWGGALVLSLAGFVSPYTFLPTIGPRPFFGVNYALLFDYLAMPPELRSTIGELRRTLEAGGQGAGLFVVALCVVARGFRWKRALAKGGSTVAFVCSAILALRSLKFLAIFAICSLPFIYICLRSASKGCPLTHRRADGPLYRCFLFLLSALFLGKALLTFPRFSGQRVDLGDLPQAACTRLAELPLVRGSDRDHFRALTHFNYGGWCRWFIYQSRPEIDIRVTTDGRTQWVPPKHYELSFDLFNVRNRWLETLQEWDPDVVLVSKDKALAQVLLRLPDNWTLAYHDDVFAIFLPKRKALT